MGTSTAGIHDRPAPNVGARTEDARKDMYDFLSPEDRGWIFRCKLVGAALFLGLIAAVALDGAVSETGSAARLPLAVAASTSH